MTREKLAPPDGYVFFTAEVRPSSASELLKVVAQALDDGLKSLAIWTTCVGGSVQAGLALHQTLLALPIELRTHNTAQITGIGNLLFVVGEQRTAAVNTRFRFLNPDPPEDEEEMPPAWAAQQERVVGLLAARTHMSVDNVKNLKERDANLQTDEALALGVIHAIEDPVVADGARIFVV